MRTGRGQRLVGWALALLAGNLALHQLPALPGPYLVLGLAAAALAALRWPALRPIAVGVLAFAWTAETARTGLDARWPEDADGQDVAVTGWIDAFVRVDPSRTVFSLRVESSEADVPIRRLRLSWYDAPEGLKPGAALAIVARLRAPRGLANPAGFDYERWLFLEGYDATGYVRSGQVEPEGRFGVAQRWLQWRARLAERIDQRVDKPDAAVLITALSLGERGRFDDRHWTVLQRTGTSHLVAVSGLHIGLIATMAFLLVFRIALRLPYPIARHAHAIAAAACLMPATVYAALAGFGLPTQRALAMLVVAQGLIAARRRWPLASGLSLALVCVLTLDPLASLTASFWLSFGAVALILAFVSAARKRASAASSAKKAAGTLLEFGRLQWVLTLGLMPLVLWFFGQLSLASFAVNLIAIPVFSLAVVPLSLATALAAALDIASFGLVPLASACAETAWRLLELAASPDLAALELPRPRLAALGLSLVAVAMLAPRHPLPGRRLAYLGLLPLAVGGADALGPGAARVTVLDVGQGLAVAVETASFRLLYDAGPRYRSGFDVGAEIVAPALAEIDAKPLDLLLLSHGDSDHAGGASGVRERYPSARMLAGPDVAGSDSAHGDAEPCLAGQAWRWDRVELEILHPPERFQPHGNESSCVLKLEAEGSSVLITGDIESRAEARLVAGAEVGADLDADIVIVPHHGSATSSSRPFVAAVSPRLAVVSAGHNNRFGHPRADVVERWEARGADVLVTADLGAITIGLGAEGITVSAERSKRRRYWQPEVKPVPGAGIGSAL